MKVSEIINDPEKFYILYKKIYSYAFKLLNLYGVRFSETIADDVASQSFDKLLRPNSSFDLEKEVEPWLYKVCSSITFNELSRIRKEQIVIDFENLEEELISDLSPEEIVLSQEEQNEQNLLITQAFNQLEPLYQLVFLLCIVGNHKTKEIARMLDKSESAIRSIKARTLVKMRKNLTALTEKVGNLNIGETQ